MVSKSRHNTAQAGTTQHKPAQHARTHPRCGAENETEWRVNGQHKPAQNSTSRHNMQGLRDVAVQRMKPRGV